MTINEAIKIVENMVETFLGCEDVILYSYEKEALDTLIKVAKQYTRDNEYGYKGM